MIPFEMVSSEQGNFFVAFTLILNCLFRIIMTFITFENYEKDTKLESEMKNDDILLIKLCRECQMKTEWLAFLFPVKVIYNDIHTTMISIFDNICFLLHILNR